MFLDDLSRFVPRFHQRNRRLAENCQWQFDRLDFLVTLVDRFFTRLRLHYHGFGAYSCGEFVAKAFTAAGIRLFPELNDDDVEPADFARLLATRQR